MSVFYLGGGWYFANEIRDGVVVGTINNSDRDFDLGVVAVADGSVTLRPTGEQPPALGTDKAYALDWGTGSGMLGDRLPGAKGADGADGAVARELTVLGGVAPSVGDEALLDKDGFLDPASAIDAPVQEVEILSDGRALPAWFVPGEGTTWAVLTHGKGVTRTEMLRHMRSTVAVGLPSLNIAYRRDPETGGGLIRFGADEWPDLEAAVQYALDQGAERIVLVGASSGAGISASFLEHSPLADEVVALAFDAPMLDFGATVAHGAEDREMPVVGGEIPTSLIWTARQIAGLRFGLDPAATTYLDDTSWLTVPTWVYHGTADATVPYSVSERLDAAAPDLVEHTLVEDAGHVESWNVVPEQFDRELQEFLARFAS